MRALWRSLTSMRTALILLLLLAVAAVPGSVFPQRAVDSDAVRGYLTDHPDTGRWLDLLGFFDVYASPWFSAIYLLLFVSLVGCLLPRLRQHLANVTSAPPDAPSRLHRLPHHAQVVGDADGKPSATALGGALRGALRRARWRVIVREHEDTSVTLSAEKGYLKETGNLVFHFALLVVLLGVAWGSWYGWHANRLVVAGPEFGFCDTLSQYDESGLGARATPDSLPAFCVTLDDFHADYTEAGMPLDYSADVSYVEGVGSTDQTAGASATLTVNHPLRLRGASMYLLSHGYAPVLRYTDRFGVTQTVTSPFMFSDAMLTSSGVAIFPDANVDPSGKTPRDTASQVAFQGVFLPTMPEHADGQLSAHPQLRKPALFLVAYEGNLGLGSGLPQRVDQLNQRQIDSGHLRVVARTKAMKPGDVFRLPDGTSVTFVGVTQWIGVSVRHDPGQELVLIGAAGVLGGLMASLLGRRRRVWARITPGDGGRSLITVGGLARGEPAGFADEFARVVALVRKAAGTDDEKGR